MTMLSQDRRRRAPGGVSRSGGRIAERHDVEHVVSGSVALQARPPEDFFEEEPLLRVAPPAPVRTAKAPFVVLVLILVIAGVVGIVVLNAKINENVFRLDKLQQTQTTLDTQEQELEADIAEQAAPGTLAGKAKELGMELPTEPPTFIVLPDGRQVDVPQPAVGK